MPKKSHPLPLPPTGKRKPKRKSKTATESVANSPRPGPRRDQDERLLKRFYEPLVLQHALSNAHGVGTPCHGNHILRDGQDECEMNHSKLRHSFLDTLANRKAANESVGAKVVQFLDEVLQSLAGLVGSASKASESSTLQCIVKFGEERLKAYWQIMRQLVKRCQGAPGKPDDQDIVELLATLEHYGDDMLRLVLFCYESRESPGMKALARRSQKYPASEDLNNHFSNMRHYIGRTGSYVKAAKILVAAAIRFPVLFDGFRIECCPSPKPAAICLTDGLTTLESLIVRMLPKGDEKVSYYQQALRTMDDKFGIFRRLKEIRFSPLVHAELILLEHFYLRQYQFFEGDKYIGCSKLACYCCHHYINVHPGNFALRGTHNKTYLNWWPPNISDGSDRLAKHQRDILNNMLKNVIRRDTLSLIEAKQGPRYPHHDSTTGITASVIPQGSFGPSGSLVMVRPGRIIQNYSSREAISTRFPLDDRSDSPADDASSEEWMGCENADI